MKGKGRGEGDVGGGISWFVIKCQLEISGMITVILTLRQYMCVLNDMIFLLSLYIINIYYLQSSIIFITYLLL